MPSLDGLKTWLDYELLFLGLAVVVVVAAWGLERVAGVLSGLPVTDEAFALLVAAVCLGGVLLVLWVVARGE